VRPSPCIAKPPTNGDRTGIAARGRDSSASLFLAAGLATPINLSGRSPGYGIFLLDNRVTLCKDLPSGGGYDSNLE
jgi:hypothetical protein